MTVDQSHSKKAPTRAVHIYPSNLTNGSRILKETESLVRGGVIDEALIVGICGDGDAEHEAVDESRVFWRAKLKLAANRGVVAKSFKFVEWYARVLLGLRNQRFAYVNCHSLSALPLSVCLAWLKGATLIYDTHELETETATSRGVRKRIAKFVERVLIKHAALVIAVSAPIAKWYEDTYNLDNVVVVRNIPAAKATSLEPSRKLRDRFSIPDDHKIFLYQGLIDEGRGVEIMLDVLPKISPSFHCIFMGYGALVPKVRQLAATSPNVHLLPAVHPQDVLSFTVGADVGVILVQKVSLSYYYSLGNKFFEYLMAGLPVIASDFPEMSKLIKSWDCGFVCEPTREGFDQLMSSLDLESIAAKRRNSAKVAKELGWHTEEDIMLAAYSRLVKD